MKKVIYFITLLLLTNIINATEFSLYERLEEQITWKNHKLNNPFTDVELKLYVEAPKSRKDGSNFVWYGFYDGDGTGNQEGDVWKFRMLFDCPGKWTVKAVFVNPLTGKEIQEAPNIPGFVYNISDKKLENRHGYVRISPDNPFRFCYDDGTPWIPFPIHSSLLLDVDTSRAFNWIDKHIKSGVDALTVRFHAEAYVKNVSEKSYFQFLRPDGSRLRHWPGGPKGKPDADTLFDYQRFDLESWHHNEQIINYAYEKNMNLSIWFGISGMNRQYWSYGPKDSPNDTTLGENQKLFIKYFLARWATYSNFWHWTIDSEYEETGKGCKERVTAYAQYMNNINPWNTLLTTHVLRNWSLGYNKQFELATLQRRVVSSPEGVINCSKFITQNLQYNKPVYNSEGVWNISNKNYTRLATLSHLFAGGFSQVTLFGAIDSVTGKKQYASEIPYWEMVNDRHKEDAKILGDLNTFFNKGAGQNINHCLPNNSVIKDLDNTSALCLAQSGNYYYIWIPLQGKVMLDLTPYKYKFNVECRSGKNLDSIIHSSTVKGGKKITLENAEPDDSKGLKDVIYCIKSIKEVQPTVEIVNYSIPPAYYNKNYNYTFDTRNASGSVLWNVEGELPQGIKFSEGKLFGTPLEYADYTIYVEAKDDKGKHRRQFTWPVYKEKTPAPTIIDEKLLIEENGDFYVAWNTDIPANSRVQWGTHAGQYTGESGVVEYNVRKHKVKIDIREDNAEYLYVLIISSVEDGPETLYEAMFILNK